MTDKTKQAVRELMHLSAEIERGKCRNTAPSYLDFLCSECGFVNYRNDENDSGGGNNWHHCPNCGRKVVDRC